MEIGPNGEGVFTDVAGMVPATEFDAVACVRNWKGDNAVILTQSNPSQRPTLLFGANGKAYFDYDGIDDTLLTVVTFGGQVTYCTGLLSKTATFNGFWSPIDISIASGDSTIRWGLFAVGTTQFHSDPFPVSVSRNGTPLASPFDCSPITNWIGLTVKTNNASMSVMRGTMQLSQAFFGNAQQSCLFIFSGTPSSGDIATVEAYTTTLQPT
jgi:hypothetical protein